MHLTDYWGQSLDYANRLTSINQAQAHRDEDGRLRYVIAHRDPGAPNWLDTTEHPSGYITLRTTFPQPPPADVNRPWPAGSFHSDKSHRSCLQIHLA